MLFGTPVFGAWVVGAVTATAGVLFCTRGLGVWVVGVVTARVGVLFPHIHIWQEKEESPEKAPETEAQTGVPSTKPSSLSLSLLTVQVPELAPKPGCQNFEPQSKYL